MKDLRDYLNDRARKKRSKVPKKQTVQSSGTAETGSARQSNASDVPPALPPLPDTVLTSQARRAPPIPARRRDLPPDEEAPKAPSTLSAPPIPARRRDLPPDEEAPNAPPTPKRSLDEKKEALRELINDMRSVSTQSLKAYLLDRLDQINAKALLPSDEELRKFIKEELRHLGNHKDLRDYLHTASTQMRSFFHQPDETKFEFHQRPMPRQSKANDPGSPPETSPRDPESPRPLKPPGMK